MIAQNTMYSPALPYGLGAARAVGRNLAELRGQLAEATAMPISEDKGWHKDLKIMESADLVSIFRDRRSLVAWDLTTKGRALFGK